MKTQYNIKKEWEKTKKQFLKLGQEATVFAKKSEKELLKLSQKGKLHLDVTAGNLKKERLYYFVGKEYVKLNDQTKPSAKLKKLVEDLKLLEKEQRALNKKLKSK